jgi:hypothetical protein
MAARIGRTMRARNGSRAYARPFRITEPVMLSCPSAARAAEHLIRGSRSTCWAPSLGLRSAKPRPFMRWVTSVSATGASSSSRHEDKRLGVRVADRAWFEARRPICRRIRFSAVRGEHLTMRESECADRERAGLDRCWPNREANSSSLMVSCPPAAPTPAHESGAISGVRLFSSPLIPRFFLIRCSPRTTPAANPPAIGRRASNHALPAMRALMRCAPQVKRPGA